MYVIALPCTQQRSSGWGICRALSYMWLPYLVLIREAQVRVSVQHLHMVNELVNRYRSEDNEKDCNNVHNNCPNRHHHRHHRHHHHVHHHHITNASFSRKAEALAVGEACKAKYSHIFQASKRAALIALESHRRVQSAKHAKLYIPHILRASKRASVTTLESQSILRRKIDTSTKQTNRPTGSLCCDI